MSDSESSSSGSEASTSTKWDPADVLELKDDFSTCRGTTTKVQRCSLRSSGNHRVPQLVARLGMLSPAAASKEERLLSQLALATLCGTYHSGQSEGIVKRWQAALEAQAKREKAFARRLRIARREHNAALKEVTAELNDLKLRQDKLIHNARQTAEAAEGRAVEAERLREEAQSRVLEADRVAQQSAAKWEHSVREAEQLRQQAEARTSLLEKESQRRDASREAERARLSEDRARMEDRSRALDDKLAAIEDRRGRLDDEWSRLAAHRDKFEEQRTDHARALLTPQPTPEKDKDKDRFRLREFVRKGLRRVGTPGDEVAAADAAATASPALPDEDIPLPGIETNTPPRTPERAPLTETLPDVPRGSPVPARILPRRKQVMAE